MNQKEYSILELKMFVEKAVKVLLEEDKSLLDKGAHEQAITHRIAVYVEKEFNDSNLNFDCEYNKHLEKSKMFLSSGPSCHCKSCRKLKEGDKLFRPDIIVHKRGTDAHNLIVVEVKKGETFCKFDTEKIIALTTKSDEYKYQVGLCLSFSNNQPKYEWFVDGQIELLAKQQEDCS